MAPFELITLSPLTPSCSGATTTLKTPGRVWANYVTGAVDTVESGSSSAGTTYTTSTSYSSY